MEKVNAIDVLVPGVQGTYQSCPQSRHDTTRHDTTRHDTTRHDTAQSGSASLRLASTAHDDVGGRGEVAFLNLIPGEESDQSEVAGKCSQSQLTLHSGFFRPTFLPLSSSLLRAAPPRPATPRPAPPASQQRPGRASRALRSMAGPRTAQLAK